MSFSVFGKHNHKGHRGFKRRNVSLRRIAETPSPVLSDVWAILKVSKMSSSLRQATL